METSVNTRVLMLKTHLGLGNNEFATKANISPTTLWNIQNEGEIAPKTIKNICEALNVNRTWLLTGKGKMFNGDPKPTEGHAFDEALNKLYETFKDQLKVKDEQIAALTSILQKVNFLKLLPEMDSDNSEQVRAAA